MKFSIITTCLNAEKHIKETIDSIFSQEGNFEIEYIVTDAGSTDRTKEIVTSYGSKAKFIDAKGTNQSEGFNVGIKHATGDLVSFLNADDTYTPGALQEVYESWNENPDSNWFIGRYKIVNSNGEEIDTFISSYKATLAKYYHYFLLLIENFVPHPSVFVKREIFEKYGDYKTDEKYAMDYDLWLRIGKDNKPAFVDYPVATFRREQGTKSNSAFVKQMRDDMRLANNYSIKNRIIWTIPFKFVSFLRTIFIYKFLYR